MPLWSCTVKATHSPSDDQLTFRTWAWDNGIPYKVARTLDRVSAILEEWDVLRLTVRVQ